NYVNKNRINYLKSSSLFLKIVIYYYSQKRQLHSKITLEEASEFPWIILGGEAARPAPETAAGDRSVRI
ncbi:hypothetical protein, partial [Neglectibacter timonensis]|uniref:hypothetical protein n=1 Tax=Neglectibacter timonensis TaxID=1776382 RepID=UPI003AB45E3D